MKKFLPVLILVCALSACGKSEGEVADKQDQNNVCTSLDSVFTGLELLEKLCDDSSANWARIKMPLQQVLEGLKSNMEGGDTSCLFLNHKIHPEVERFAFVESLRRRIVRDTITDGLYFLIRLRGVFARDEEIQEFFSEEIAAVAYKNPLAYVGYLRRDPGQRQMLLNTTRWSIFREDSLINRFRRTRGGEEVVLFLERLGQSGNGSE